MDDVGYGALAAALVLVGGLYTWTAYRRNGLAAGLRGASFTLLVVAAYLTRTLQLVGRVADAVGDWATSLVFSPVVWVGVVVAGIAVALFGASRVLAARSPRTPRQELPAPPSARSTRSARSARAAPVDDDLADIEALLRDRGIS